MSAILFLSSCWGDPKLDKNAKNIREVKVGMTVPSVEKVMGKPDSLVFFPTEPDVFMFMYNVPVGMSDNIYVAFSKTDSTVLRINDGQ
jgi:hypothetical protein